MAATNELTTIIDRLVSEKTFSLDALDGVKEIKERAHRLEQRCVELGERETAARVENLRLSNERDNLRAKVDAWEKRESELIVREKAIHEHEKKAAVAVAEAGAFRHALEVVFRPNTIRSNIHSSVPVHEVGPGGYGHTTWHNKSEQNERTEG